MPALLSNNNRSTMEQIARHIPLLATANPAGTEGQWNSRLPIVKGSHIILNYLTGVIDKRSYSASFKAEQDAAEVRISLSGLVHKDTKQPLRPGVIEQETFGARRKLELLPPGQVDGFVVTGARRTGMVVVHGLIEGQERPLPFTDNIDACQIFLGACQYAITSDHPEKFRQPVSA